jgi:hypothetical protein
LAGENFTGISSFSGELPSGHYDPSRRVSKDDSWRVASIRVIFGLNAEVSLAHDWRPDGLDEYYDVFDQ